MCNQAVGLVAAELERQGVSTVAIQFMRPVAERIRPPRALVVPYLHGFPLGQPCDPPQQRLVIESAFALLEDADTSPGTVMDYVPLTDTEG